MGAWLTTRETVAAALDINSTANTDDQLDRAVATASDLVEDYLRRRFRPEQATKYLEWPRQGQGEPYWEADLGHEEVISVTTVKTNDTTVTGYNLEPNETGPPYTRIEMPRTGSGFNYGDTPQRNLEITGLFGFRDDRVTVGTLSSSVTDSATTITLPTSGGVGVGSTLIIGTERLAVTARTFVDTGTTITGALTADMADTTVPVSSATGYVVGEYIVIDSERMRVDAITGTNLTVRRATDGTTLAAHTSSTAVYANRQVTVTRGAQGTTAAAHSSGATVERWQPPQPVESLAVAEAVLVYENERAGWARTIGSGDSEAEAKGSGVGELRRRVFRTHGRRHRMVSV